MSCAPSIPIQIWNVVAEVVPNTLTSHWSTIQLLTPSVSTAAEMPGAPVPSRSVQNGARTLFGRAGSGIAVRLQQLLSSDVPPPATA